jgi:hypothetical protein
MIPVDAGAIFRRYFESSQAGGAFAMRATFPVTGDATRIGGVDVKVTNSAGVISARRINF